jgi:hypothetical protein
LKPGYFLCADAFHRAGPPLPDQSPIDSPFFASSYTEPQFHFDLAAKEQVKANAKHH